MGKPHRKELKMKRICGVYRWSYTDATREEPIEYEDYETFSGVVSTDIADVAYATYLMISGIYQSMQYRKLDPATDLLAYELLDFSVKPIN